VTCGCVGAWVMVGGGGTKSMLSCGKKAHASSARLKTNNTIKTAKLHPLRFLI